MQVKEGPSVVSLIVLGNFQDVSNESADQQLCFHKLCCDKMKLKDKQ